VLCLSN